MKDRIPLEALVSGGPDFLTWKDDAGDPWVRFDRDGLAFVHEDGERIAWRDVLDLSIDLPVSGPRRFAFDSVLSTYGPKPYEYGLSGAVLFVLNLRREDRQYSWPRTGRVEWRVDFALDDLLMFLRRRGQLSRLHEGATVVGALEACVRAMPEHSRFLRRVDLFGLDRHIGGHGSWGLLQVRLTPDL